MILQSSTENLPKVIFFDAMGTLFDLNTSVGEIYQKFALKYGVKVDLKTLNTAFGISFKSAPPLAFEIAELDIIKQQEFDWWKNVVEITFSQISLLGNFSDFNSFFQEIYTYFGTKEPWYVFSDVIPTLEKCQNRGIQLGIISNFDTRLNQVLNQLSLADYFETITISSVAGFAKPDQNVFNLALKKHNFTEQQALHIGDSIIEDYQGAKNTGINSFWLNRREVFQDIENQLPNLSSLG